MLRNVAFGVLALVSLLSVMTLRCVLEARAELTLAQAARRAGDLVTASTHLRRAARWDAPFNLYAQQALSQLEQLANESEARGEQALALMSYRGVHAALHATRGFQISNPEQLARVDDKIAALMAQQPAPEMDADKPLAVRQAELRKALDVEGPRTLGVLLACGGFFAWIGAFTVLVLRGLDREGRIVRSVARPAFLGLVFGWLAFAVGLQIA